MIEMTETLAKWDSTLADVRGGTLNDVHWVAYQLEEARDEVKRLLHLVNTISDTAHNRQEMLNKLRGDLALIHRDTMELHYDISNLMHEYGEDRSHEDHPIRKAIRDMETTDE